MHCRAAGLGTGGSRGSPGLGFGEQPQELWEPSLGPSSSLPGPGSILSHNNGINWEFTPWGWSSSCGDKIYPTGDRSHPTGTEFTMWGWNSPCGDGIPSVGMELILWGQNSSYGGGIHPAGMEFIPWAWNSPHWGQTSARGAAGGGHTPTVPAWNLDQHNQQGNQNHFESYFLFFVFWGVF